jgi:hypothetical protein
MYSNRQNLPRMTFFLQDYDVSSYFIQHTDDTVSFLLVPYLLNQVSARNALAFRAVTGTEQKLLSKTQNPNF